MPQQPTFRRDLEIIGDSGRVGYTRRVTVKDPMANKYYRISQFELRLLKMLDGNLDVGEAVAKLKAQAHLLQCIAKSYEVSRCY